MKDSLEEALTRHAKYKWIPRLTTGEENAIIRYTDIDIYVSVNKTLRDDTNILGNPVIGELIKGIESGLKKFRYSKSLTVYRSVSEEEYIFIENNNVINSFSDFKSTTICKIKALNFSKNKTKYLILAQLPAYVNGAYIAPLSKFEDEKEFLLNRESNYKIISKQHDTEKDVKYIFLKVV